MLSSVALRAQIASVIDALSKAAAAEIAKVVEDGLVVLRLEVCQRENEIKKLKSNIEVLHSELRSAQERGTLRPDTRGKRDINTLYLPCQPAHPPHIHPPSHCCRTHEGWRGRECTNTSSDLGV